MRKQAPIPLALSVRKGLQWTHLRGAAAAICLIMTLGCQQQMAEQPRFWPLEESKFFADGRSSRPLEPGTVARGQLEDDPHLYTGRRSGAHGIASYFDTFPFPITRADLRRGQERYGIFCALCHGTLGDGDGKIVQRGFTRPPSFHTDLARGLKGQRLKEAPHGYYFEVITNGHGAMASYAAQVPAQDRWRIIAYIRALQLSQDAPLEAVPEAERQQLEAKP